MRTAGFLLCSSLDTSVKWMINNFEYNHKEAEQNTTVCIFIAYNVTKMMLWY